MRKSIAAAALGALVAAILVVLPASPAAATTAGVPFSADDLPTWQTNGLVRGLAHSHGKIVAGGSFTELRPPVGGSGTPQAVTSLAIFNAATGEPDSCQLPLGLSGGTPVAWAVVAAPDGDTVFVGGNFGSVGGVPVSRLAEIDVVNCVVTSFRPATISSFVYAMAVTDTTVYIAGRFLSVGGQPRESFAALSRADGSVLPWVADGSPNPGRPDPPSSEYDYDGHAVAVSPDGTKVAIGGGFDRVNGQPSRALAIVDATTGALVHAYTNNFVPTTSTAKSLVTYEGSLYAGFEGTGGGVFDGSIRIDWSTYQQVWRDTCLGATQAVLPYQGILFEAHHHHDCSSMGGFPDGKRIYLTASTVDDPQQLGWYPTLSDGIGEGIGPRAFAVGSGGGTDYLWVGGEFIVVNGSPQQSLTRFGPTDTGNPGIPAVDVQALTSGAIQVRLRSVYDPDDGVLTYAVYRNGSSTPIWTGQAHSTWWYRPQVTFVDTDVTPGVEYSYRVRAIDAAGNQSGLSPTQTVTATSTGSAYAAAIIADEPTLYWRYDDPASNWVVDSSGQTVTGKNGLAVGDITRDAGGAIPGDPSRAATFNGTSQYIWNDQIAYGPTTYTIETWFNTTSTKGGSIVGYGNGRPRTDNGNNVASSSYDRIVYIEDSGRLRFGVYTGSAQTIRSDQAYNDGEWHHVVATQGPEGMRLYVDGVLVGQNSVTTAQQYYGMWHVGGDNLNSWPSAPSGSIRFYKGLLDETAIYPRALTFAEVIEHYQLGGGDLDLNESPADAYGAAVFDTGPMAYWRLDETSGNTAVDASWLGGRNGVIGNSVTKNGAGAIATGTAMRTPGSNSNGSGIITSSSSMGSPATFSVEAWIKTNTNSGGKIIGFENNQFGNATSYDKHIYMRNDGRLMIGVYTGSTQTAVSAASYNDNQWHHVVGTQGPNGLRLYVDGALVASNTATTNENITGYWRVGGGNLNTWPNRPSSDYFNGWVDEVAIYTAALAPNTILAHYAIGKQDSTAPSVPSSVAGSVNGTAIELSWSASTDNYGLAGYRVYSGSTDSFTVGPESLVGNVTATTWVDPDETPGVRYYRVTAYDLAGNESAPSDAVMVNLSDIVAPTTPTNLQGSPANADVSLTWNAATDNVGVDHYVVYRGTTDDFVADAESEIGTAVGPAYVDTDLTEGTWYYRVAAVDAAGNTSAPTAATAVEVDLDTEAPTAPTNLAGQLTGADTVSLTWTAATDDVGVAGYRVYRGTSPDFALDETSLRTEVTSTSFVDTGVPYGVAYYRVTAVDEAENESSPSARVSVVVPVTVTAIADTMVAQNNASFVYGSNNQISARDQSGSTIESYLTFALPAAPAGTALTGASLRVVTSTDATANSTGAHQFLLMTGSWSEATTTWNNRPTTGFGPQLGELTGAVALNTPYVVTLDAQALAGLTGTDVSLALRSTSTDNVRLWSREHTVAAARPTLTLTYTAVVVDTEAPSVPTGLTGHGTAAGEVSLSWTPSTDDVGVAGYLVYRGDSAEFVADETSLVGDVAVAEFAEDELAVGDWYYRVAAYDAAQNVSAASAAVKVTVPEVLEPVVMEVVASADTMVAQNNASFVYGSNNQISARDQSGSTLESYLTFALPEAPAGLTLTGVSLRVVTSTDATANSTGAHQFLLMTGSWSEATTTWNNRPTTGFGPQLGELTGAVALNTPYVVTLDAQALAGLTGTDVSLAMRSTSTDNVRLWSREHTVASARPTLILTYSQV